MFRFIKGFTKLQYLLDEIELYIFDSDFFSVKHTLRPGYVENQNK